MLTQTHSRLLYRGPEFDARAALRAAAAAIRKAICGIGGHDYYVRSTRTRLFLRCLGCGHETPGWQIDLAPRLARRIVRRG